MDDAELMRRYITTKAPDLREAIILRYVPLVHFVLGRLGLSIEMGMDYEDMVSQGLLGLIQAIDRYDPSYGTQFSTYATLRIRGQVLDHLRAMDWLPRAARQRVRAVQEAMTTLWSRLERAPTEEELASHLNLDLPKLRKALVDSSRMIISLDSVSMPDDSDEGSLYEVLVDERQDDPSDLLIQEEIKDRLIEALKALPDREQLILSLYYSDGLTMKEIGNLLEVSESRVCQLHGRAVMNLKSLLTQSETPEGKRGGRVPRDPSPEAIEVDYVSQSASGEHTQISYRW